MRYLTAVLALVAATAHAEFYTGTRLLGELTLWEQVNDKGTGNAREAWDSGQGFGYLKGVVDALLPRLCIPPSATDVQVARVVVKFLRETPSLHHLSADTLIVGAVNNAWPCPKGGSR